MPRKVLWVGGILAGLIAIACTQISIVSVGGKGAGSTGVVHRGGSLSYLKLIDSSRAACSEGRSPFARGGKSGGQYGPLEQMGRKEYCEGGTTIQIAESGRVLIRLPYIELVRKLSL